MDKRDSKREYKETTQPMGVFQIRNLTNGKVWIGSSLNLEAIFNRHRFALGAGSHQNKALQADWKIFGADQFAFEVLEELEPRQNADRRSELAALENLWLEKEEPYGERGYNERKLTREERLRMIAAKKRL
jgi:group I intron endonuclease